MELLTIAEIARTLAVPDSTVRYYRDRFDDKLPCVGSGRSRRYMPEVIDILRDIMGAVKDGATVQEVRTSLSAGQREVAATAVSPKTAAASFAASASTSSAATATLERPASTSPGDRTTKATPGKANPKQKLLRQDNQQPAQKGPQKGTQTAAQRDRPKATKTNPPENTQKENLQASRKGQKEAKKSIQANPQVAAQNSGQRVEPSPEGAPDSMPATTMPATTMAAATIAVAEGQAGTSLESANLEGRSGGLESAKLDSIQQGKAEPASKGLSGTTANPTGAGSNPAGSPLQKAGMGTIAVKRLPMKMEAPMISELQSVKDSIQSEIKELHEEISVMREMMATLLQEQSESQVGERDKQLVEALKGLQSMKAPKRRWFGLRT